ncbi:MAG: TRAP transporter substrate-binding protein [Syntrophobacterales bacterium]|nr:TRAP transporter substrate-binding protein [Syntrophobacterales bacterium]
MEKRVKNSFYLTLAVILALSVGLIMSPVASSNAVAKTIKIRMVGTLPIGHHLTKALNLFAKVAEEKSNNRVKFTLYPAQQLYNDKDLVNVLPKGAVDAAIINSGLWSGKVKSGGPLFFPFYYKDRDTFYSMFKTKAWDIISKDFEKEGNVKVLSLIEYGSSTLISKEKIASLADWKGTKIRSYSRYGAVALQALGSAPVVMSSGDVYMALQRGTLDGALSGVSSFVSRKWMEQCKYFLKPNFCQATPFLLVFNLRFWNKLPKDIQQILQEAALEAQAYTIKFTSTSDIKYRKVLRDKGLTEVPISPEEVARWTAKVVPALKAEYVKQIGAAKAEKILSNLPK